MKFKSILALIIGLGFIVHAFITPVFYIEWIISFMIWAQETWGKFLGNLMSNAFK